MMFVRASAHDYGIAAVGNVALTNEGLVFAPVTFIMVKRAPNPLLMSCLSLFSCTADWHVFQWRGPGPDVRPVQQLILQPQGDLRLPVRVHTATKQQHWRRAAWRLCGEPPQALAWLYFAGYFKNIVKWYIWLKNQVLGITPLKAVFTLYCAYSDYTNHYRYSGHICNVDAFSG